MTFHRHNLKYANPMRVYYSAKQQQIYHDSDMSVVKCGGRLLVLTNDGSEYSFEPVHGQRTPEGGRYYDVDEVLDCPILHRRLSMSELAWISLFNPSDGITVEAIAEEEILDSLLCTRSGLPGSHAR